MQDSSRERDDAPNSDAIRRTGWMTKRDAELFAVLARGLEVEDRRQVAKIIDRADEEADRQVGEQEPRGQG